MVGVKAAGSRNVVQLHSLLWILDVLHLTLLVISVKCMGLHLEERLNLLEYSIRWKPEVLLLLLNNHIFITDRQKREWKRGKKKSDMISCSVWLHLDHYCSDRLGCWSKWCSFNEGVLQVKIIYILTFILHPALLWASTSHHKRAWNMQSHKVKNAKAVSSWKIRKKFCDVSLKCLAPALNPDRILPGPNTVHVENFSIWELNLQVRLGWVCSDLW